MATGLEGLLDAVARRPARKSDLTLISEAITRALQIKNALDEAQMRKREMGLKEIELLGIPGGEITTPGRPLDVNLNENPVSALAAKMPRPTTSMPTATPGLPEPSRNTSTVGPFGNLLSLDTRKVTLPIDRQTIQIPGIPGRLQREAMDTSSAVNLRNTQATELMGGPATPELRKSIGSIIEQQLPAGLTTKDIKQIIDAVSAKSRNEYNMARIGLNTDNAELEARKQRFKEAEAAAKTRAKDYSVPGNINAFQLKLDVLDPSDAVSAKTLQIIERIKEAPATAATLRAELKNSGLPSTVNGALIAEALNIKESLEKKKIQGSKYGFVVIRGN